MALSKSDIAKEIYHRLKKSHPEITLQLTQKTLTQFLLILKEKVLEQGMTARLRPFGTLERRTRKAPKSKEEFEYIHLRTGKLFKRKTTALALLLLLTTAKGETTKSPPPKEDDIKILYEYKCHNGKLKLTYIAPNIPPKEKQSALKNEGKPCK